ncbi:hypothetical protein AB3A94_001262 [Vibrio alginolyticus]|uniref:hypothetical protein n=1 Tax=Vibrio TaxID=662 RepID=UPI0028FC2DC3|nr:MULTISPECIES: hypothetical protein [Vibrio]MDW1552958.1 hypothetical protein [Vibrio sp. YT-18]WNW05096.1 hypothetical protein RO483_09000 [Vibrio alginolyticus]
MQRQMNRDEVAYFYQSVGEAIWHMQYVEQTLGQMLLIMGRGLKPKSLHPEEAEKKLQSVQKKKLLDLSSMKSLKRVFYQLNLKLGWKNLTQNDVGSYTNQ